MKPLIGALACAALVTLCVLYVDRPVASFVAAHDGYLLFYDALASPSLLALPFAFSNPRSTGGTGPEALP